LAYAFCFHKLVLGFHLDSGAEAGLCRVITGGAGTWYHALTRIHQSRLCRQTGKIEVSAGWSGDRNVDKGFIEVALLLIRADLVHAFRFRHLSYGAATLAEIA
jgi:hypothetical protein